MDKFILSIAVNFIYIHNPGQINEEIQEFLVFIKMLNTFSYKIVYFNK